MSSTAERLSLIVNGPIVAGIGATVDSGLWSSAYHVLPYDPTKKVVVYPTEDKEHNTFQFPIEHTHEFIDYEPVQLLRYAIYNVDRVFDFDTKFRNSISMEDNLKDILYKDAIAIVFLMLCYNYYYQECRESTSAEKNKIDNITISAEFDREICTKDRLNRASKLIFARIHTKYQTNHAMGGTPPQASIASALRDFYQISYAGRQDNTRRSIANNITSLIYWVTHPINETLLLPLVIKNSKIMKAQVHAAGSQPSATPLDEYFTTRSSTPPAGTHRFHVAASAMTALEPLGILGFLPEIQRVDDVRDGLIMIETHGAKLHPAARNWGLEPVSSNQRAVESICADLGYALRRLMPKTSLAKSPNLKKEDKLNIAWKFMVDSLRLKMKKAENEKG